MGNEQYDPLFGGINYEQRLRGPAMPAAAEAQAKAQLDSIIAMIERLEHARECHGRFGENCELKSGTIYAGLNLYDDGASNCTQDEWNQYHNKDAALEAIQEHPLSVLVRSGWYSMDGKEMGTKEPVEYEILLCTGGPAVRIQGDLDNYGQPKDARLEYQDWGTPWTEYRYTYQYTSENCPGRPCSNVCDHVGIPPSNHVDTLLTYAQQFYFGD